MAKQPIDVAEEWQNLIDSKLLENITTDPEFCRRFFVSNVFQRTLAHAIAEADSGAVKLKATEAGALHVASAGTSFSHNDTVAKFTVADAYAEKAFAQVCSRVDITVWTYGVIVKRNALSGGSYEDEIEIPAGVTYSFDCDTFNVSVKNQTGGSDASCQIVGWY